ncbi:MAG: hypothetical protein J6O47_06285 [Algoriella sp.]|nr:hypothetical protein [Algoriella sp.]
MLYHSTKRRNLFIFTKPYKLMIMKEVFFLKTCDTCKRILNEFDFTGFDLHEIKSTAITEEQLNEMKNLAGSYEALFSRRAQNYKKLGLKDVQLSEEDIKNYILSDYTFLKRPVIIDGDKIFVGSEKKNLEALGQHLK